MTIPVITIDGPAGSGKGTISTHVAKALSWHMLDSGALYRLVALSAIKNDVAVTNYQALGVLAKNLDVTFDIAKDEVVVLLEGDVVTYEMRTEDCGRIASEVAACGEVRKALLARQRAFLTKPGLVADGRDMGTVVFPLAKTKVFLTASAIIRAKRRQSQLKQQGSDVRLPRLVRDIEERDARDSSRKESPLKAAEDAFVINTDNLSIEQVVDTVLTYHYTNKAQS
jgi:cytidylate kinase